MGKGGSDPADPARDPALDLPGAVDPHAQRGTTAQLLSVTEQQETASAA